MKKRYISVILAISLSIGVPTTAFAQENFELTSPSITDGGILSDDLKCERHGGRGLSPPVAWTAPPEGTKALALMMYHYPKGTVEGVDSPSHYWLLWNIPLDTESLPAGNPASLGDEGADKDGKRIGYTPPCSPSPWWSFFSSTPQHQYFIKLFALNAPLTELPTRDDQNIDWATITKAIDGKIVASSQMSFWD